MMMNWRFLAEPLSALRQDKMNFNPISSIIVVSECMLLYRTNAKKRANSSYYIVVHGFLSHASIVHCSSQQSRNIWDDVYGAILGGKNAEHSLILG